MYMPPFMTIAFKSLGLRCRQRHTKVGRKELVKILLWFVGNRRSYGLNGGVGRAAPAQHCHIFPSPQKFTIIHLYYGANKFQSIYTKYPKFIAECHFFVPYPGIFMDLQHTARVLFKGWLARVLKFMPLRGGC
jgi:hypothetical protein